MRGGRVSLDERRCWLDVRALERQFEQAERSDKKGASVEDCAERLLNLYRGPFLEDEEGEWAQRLRKRLREGVARCLTRCVITMRSAGQREAAARLVERAMEVDPDAVDRYRELGVV